MRGHEREKEDRVRRGCTSRRASGNGNKSPTRRKQSDKVGRTQSRAERGEARRGGTAPRNIKRRKVRKSREIGGRERVSERQKRRERREPAIIDRKMEPGMQKLCKNMYRAR